MDWHLHLDPPRSGAYNMAKDEYCLARAASAGQATLRLYGWERLTVSVGRAQRVDRELDPAACRAEAVPLVRRITGGRAVLHGSDITYAVAAPLSAPFGGGILAIYRELSQAFVRFFSGLGLRPEVKAYTGRERAAQASDICFYTPSAFEILLGGRKIVGSAQRLLPGAFLQHGSIPLAPQPALLARLFRGASAAGIAARMTDLESEGLLARHGVEALRERLARAFAGTLGVRLVAAPWTEADEAMVHELTGNYPPLEADAPPTPAAPPPGGAARPAASRSAASPPAPRGAAVPGDG